MPISDQIVSGEITMPQGKKFQFGAREGTMVTIQGRSSGYFVGFVAKIDNLGHSVTVRVYKVASRGGDENQGAYQILNGTITLKVGVEGTIQTEFGDFKVRYDKISTGVFPGIELIDPQTATPSELQRLYGSMSGGLCCVGCGGIEICGSKVSFECGRCSGSGAE